MPHLEAVKHILDTTLGLNGRLLESHTPLLGSVGLRAASAGRQ